MSLTLTWLICCPDPSHITSVYAGFGRSLITSKSDRTWPTHYWQTTMSSLMSKNEQTNHAKVHKNNAHDFKRRSVCRHAQVRPRCACVNHVLCLWNRANRQRWTCWAVDDGEPGLMTRARVIVISTVTDRAMKASCRTSRPTLQAQSPSNDGLWTWPESSRPIGEQGLGQPDWRPITTILRRCSRVRYSHYDGEGGASCRCALTRPTRRTSSGFVRGSSSPGRVFVEHTLLRSTSYI